MSIKDKKTINVLNYNENCVSIATRDSQYMFNPAENDTPTIIPLSFTEIEFVNSNSNSFKSGTLRFPEDLEEEIYTELRIINWENILTNSDIENILLNPSLDGLKRIVSIANSSVFERVRGIFTRLKNSGQTDISIRVERIINTRYKELVNHQTKTSIVLTPKDNIEKVSLEEVDSLRNQLAEMQKMMQQMMTNQVQTKIKETSQKDDPKVKNIKVEAPAKKTADKPSAKK